MYKILEELNKTTGINGSMIVGEDGIVIAADLNAQLQDEAVGALAASIVGTVKKSMERLSNEDLKQITVEASKGKLFFTEVGIGILAVTTDPQVNVGLVRLEIKNAAEKIRLAQKSV
ncbi:MAG: roadblock/LC7 domain-containing protein [candidate division Zixibacteria bacterium]|nr:roadblock/LC7 domain-containing protein [candidate division Zixibacteria bacterium]